MDKISVILSCYNEEKSVPLFYAAIEKAIKDIVRQLDSKQTEYGTLADSVHFGLIAFRSNIDNKPQLEYVSKMFVAPGEATSIDDFEKSLANLKEAKVSTALFDEDAYSGVNMALQNINWNSYGGRYIVLITDAGAIDSSNALSSTGLDAKALRLEASHKGAALYTLHLSAIKYTTRHDGIARTVPTK